jgi:hypothetical protein
MRKALVLGIIVCFGLGLFLSAGCAKKSSSSSEAIQNSESFKTVQEKVNYLIGQAKAFYNSKEYQKAVETAQYVLNKLDNTSQAAKDLIEKAKSQFQAAAGKAAGDVQNKLFGN